MKIFTKSPVRNIWRLLLVAWLFYVAISLISTVVAMLPIEPIDRLMGFDLENPNVFAGTLVSVIAIAITAFIYITPALYLWAIVEKKFWPQPGTPINFKETTK